MSAEPKRIEELVRGATQFLLAIGAFLAAVGGGAEWLQKVLDGLIGTRAALLASWFIPAVTAIGLVAWGASTTRKRSTLKNNAAFDLHVNGREQLFGRENDVRNLLEAISVKRIVFLTGDSGAGKSALVAAGLIPDIMRQGRMLPILVSRYGSDWVQGPLQETSFALWESLSPDERELLGLKQRQAPSSVSCDSARAWLAAIHDKLGRIPLLVFDQFDDYQARHRERFLTGRQSWLAKDELKLKNDFWRMVSEQVAAGTVRLMVVTRTDSADGLECIRFTDDLESKPLSLVDGIYLPQLLDSLAPEGVDPPVIANPDFGWTQLKVRLAADLQDNGLVLPQRVRTVLQGLRTLPALTVGEYKRAGGAEGAEAAFVLNAIGKAARASGLEPGSIRSLLAALVDRGDGRIRPKARPRSKNELEQILGQGKRCQSAIDALELSELLRQVPNVETGEIDWCLDHDYLATAVIAEQRKSNRDLTLLRDGEAAWRRSTGGWRASWRTLLPIGTQLAVLWSRLRGRLRYQEFGRYALWSTLRFAPPLIVLAAIPSVTFYVALHLSAVRDAEIIAGKLEKDSTIAAGVVLELWSAPQEVRARVLNKLMANPQRLRAAGTDWVRAVAGLDASVARDIAARTLAVSSTLDTPFQPASFDILVAVAPRLDEEGADFVAGSLRRRLTEMRADDQSFRFYQTFRALGAVAPKLSSTAAGQLLRDALGRLDTAASTWGEGAMIGLADALKAVASRLEDDKARELGHAMITRLAAPRKASDERHGDLVGVLANAARNRHEQTVQGLADDLNSRLAKAELQDDQQTVYNMIHALGAVAPGLSSIASKKLAHDLLSRLDKALRDGDATKQTLLARQLVPIAAKLDEGATLVFFQAVSAWSQLSLDREVMGAMSMQLEAALQASGRKLHPATARQLVSRLINDLDASFNGDNQDGLSRPELGAIRAATRGLRDTVVLDDVLARLNKADQTNNRASRNAMLAALAVLAPDRSQDVELIRLDKQRPSSAAMAIETAQALDRRSPVDTNMVALEGVAGELAKALVQQVLDSKAGALDQQWQRREALRALIPRLNADTSAALATTIVAALVSTREPLAELGDKSKQPSDRLGDEHGVIEALGIIASRLTEERASVLASEIAASLERGGSGRVRGIELRFAWMLRAVVPALGREAAARLSNSLLGKIRYSIREENELDEQILVEIIGALSPNLDGSVAKAAALELSDRLIDQRKIGTRRATYETIRQLSLSALADPARVVDGVKLTLWVASYPVPADVVGGFRSYLNPRQGSELSPLELVAKQPFNGDLIRAAQWARKTYGIDPSTVR